MRDYVKKQLAKCSYADLSHYDENTGTFFIPKYTKPTYDIGKMYLVQLSKSVIRNTGSVLASNWNHCTAPQTEYLKIYISKIAGRMIYVDSLGYDIEARRDLPNMWSGWLSVDDLTQISMF